MRPITPTTSRAGAYVAFAPATDQVIVRCFTLPDPGDGDDFYGTDLMLGRETRPGDVPVTGPVPITDPVTACADPWRQGLLSYGVKTPVAEELSPTALPVPQLTACVLESGIAGVFPADRGICARLGLPSLAP